MKKSKYFLNRIITYSLVCITLISSCLLAGIYAKYVSVSESTGSVGVVEFNITQEGTIFTETIKTKVTPGTTECKRLTIKNKSGSSIKYTLTVKNVTGNIAPLRFKLEPVDSAPIVTNTYENGLSVNTATRQAGNYEDEFILNIVWEKSANEETDLAYVGMVDYITISVTAMQNE